jgi:exopolyphosphatase/guanosine-5'-triphosphate,3'-diphosphate pyrophosphatase
MRISAENMDIRVEFPDEWLSEHPLTETEIAREAEYLAAAGFTLQYA